jgi:tRNA-dihydrouridine synthase
MIVKNIWQQFSEPFFVLAPMDDVTDAAFRSIVADCAPPDVFFTEFVNVDALQTAGRASALRRLQTLGNDQPLVVQLWGKTPENYFKTVQQLLDGTFALELGWPKDAQLLAGIDINMGCPDKTVVGNGCCSALINDRDLASAIITATTQAAAGRVAVSVKTRLGFGNIDYSWHQFLLGHDIQALTVHARTRQEMSKVPAHWQDLEPIVALRDKLAPNTKIIGNGDVMSRQHGIELARTHKIDGVMVGRAIFSDPYVFGDVSPWHTMSSSQKVQLYISHIERYVQFRPDAVERVDPLKKFCKVYINGFEGASEIRAEFMQLHGAAAMLDYLSKL